MQRKAASGTWLPERLRGKALVLTISGMMDGKRILWIFTTQIHCSGKGNMIN